MENDYPKLVIKKKLDIEAVEKAVLANNGNLQTLTNANSFLTPIQEMIVKAVYLSGGIFKSDFLFMFAFSYDTQTIERNLKELAKQGYLIFCDTPFGRLYGLSKNGIEQIRCNPCYFAGNKKDVNLQDMKIKNPNAYQGRKLVSYAIAEHIFRVQLVQLWNQYATTDKIERNIFLAKLYLKNIRYRDFLKEGKEQKKAYLLKIGIDEDVAEIMSERTNIIPKYAEIFAEKAFSYIGFESLKKEKEYIDYIAYFKENCRKEPNLNTFYALRDMRKKEPNQYKELDILRAWKCNVIKYGNMGFLKSFDKTELLDNMINLEKCNLFLGIIGNEARRLTATNAFKNKDNEEELKDVLDKLSLLDEQTLRLKQHKELLESDFSFPVMVNYDEEDTESEQQALTFTRLAQNGIYFENEGNKRINP